MACQPQTIWYPLLSNEDFLIYAMLSAADPAYADSKAQNQRIDKIEAAISGVADSVRQIQQFLQSSTIKTRKE